MLRLENVSKIYGESLIFRSISLELERGQIMLLTGPNGAGKSTLLRIMAGLSRPSSGKTIRDVSEAQIGYMGHQTFIYPQLSAFENLRFWGRLYGFPSAEKTLECVLERVELARFGRERAGNFSRGMAQRLNLARVLLQSPALLLLDEPATGLDNRSRQLLKKEILLAARNGAGVVWISHSLDEDLPGAHLVAELPGTGLQKKGGKFPDGLVYFGPVSGYAGSACQADAAPGGANSSRAPAAPLVKERSSGTDEKNTGIFKAAAAIAAKDLTLVIGRGTGLAQSFLLGLLLIFIFSLSRGVGELTSAQAAAAIFWLAAAFCQVLIFTSLYALEEQNGQRQGLLLAPAPLQSVWLGKALAGLLLLALAQLLFLPAAIVFMDQPLDGSPAVGLGALLLADIGLAAVGSLLGALAQGQAARESLLSIIVFPLLLPLLLAAIRTGAALFSPEYIEEAAGWLRILLAFDALFLAAGLLLFGFVYNAQE